jgi:hypothetical protein
MSFWIVETQDQLSQLHVSEECYINVIPLSPNYHPLLTEVSLIYYKPKYGKGLILTINHSEGFYLSLDKVKEFILKHENIYVLDKKTTAHLMGEEFLANKVQDINLLSMYTSTSTPYIQDCNTNIHTHFERLYTNKPYLNSIIPICKHYEKQEKIYNVIQQWVGKQHEISYYNEQYIEVFYGIEKQGIALDMPVFNENFSLNNPKFSIRDNKIYTQFNLNNFTSRPTNSFNGINFAALNKNNGQRAAIIPQNDVLFEFDYDSYHPRILAKQIGYEFNEASVHTHLGKMYFKTEELTPEQYQASKELTFKQLYGGVFEQYKDIPFFAKVKQYTDKIFEDFNSLGYIELIGGRKLFAGDIENVTPQKLLNYIIQSGETFYNVNSIKKVLEYLDTRKSNIILYTYDSILLDYSREDGKEVLKDIKNLLENEFGFKVNASFGVNYNELKRL